MSEENVEIVRRGFEAADRNDIEGMLADVAPELITERHEFAVATYQGPEGILQAYMEWIEDFDGFSVTGEEFIDANDQVLVRVHQRAVGSGSGVPIDADFWFLYTLRDQKIVRLDMYPHKAEALEAAGLSE